MVVQLEENRVQNRAHVDVRVRSLFAKQRVRLSRGVEEQDPLVWEFIYKLCDNRIVLEKALEHVLDDDEQFDPRGRSLAVPRLGLLYRDIALE